MLSELSIKAQVKSKSIGREINRAELSNSAWRNDNFSHTTIVTRFGSSQYCWAVYANKQTNNRHEEDVFQWIKASKQQRGISYFLLALPHVSISLENLLTHSISHKSNCNFACLLLFFAQFLELHNFIKP